MSGISGRSRGFTLIELMIVVSIIGILALIAIPNYQHLRERAYDASAISAGRGAKMAEEVYFQVHQEEAGIGYTSSLVDLIRQDRNLADDRDVTFVWSHAGATNFTFTTTHSSGTRTFVYHD